MAEVTRVPLQPIAKGSLTKLWLGVLAAVLLAGGIAWAAQPQGLVVTELAAGAGDGDNPELTDVVFIDYVGKLTDGTEFDRSQPAAPLPPELEAAVGALIPDGQPMELATTVPGFQQAIVQMERGGRYEVRIPARLAYGDSPPPGSPIEPGSDLVFEITLHDFFNETELQARGAQINAAMQAAMPGMMGPGGPEAGGPEAGGPPPPPVQ